MKSFWLAWQFLTRLPAPVYTQVSDKEIGHSQAWYPLVGLLIGGVLYGFALVLQQTPLTLPIHAALLLLVWVALTGGLHLDGLADIADAWVGGQGDRDRALKIMKDPVSGPIGVTALVLLLLLKFVLLQQLLAGNIIGLILLPALARALVPLLFMSMPYLRANGLGKALAEHLPRMAVMLSWLLLLGLATYLIGIAAWWLLLSLLGLFVLLRYFYLSRFGGLTGDMVGAAIEIVETGLLLTLLLLNF
ncbi:MAG: adenosylcobinamide-GDP ribazoletransferase [Gammaproteobacteria bacterium]|nr:adenosylcobinamide-GDP ribazoletransferase [Gammaproteobacteria bacterium]